MARRVPKRTVGLAFEDWPAIDRKAWERANALGDVLIDGGPAAGWKPKGRRSAMKAYGYWLRFLENHGHLGDVAYVGGRLTEENLRDYIKSRRARVASTTVVSQLRGLSQAIRAMDPEADRFLIKRAISQLTATATPVRNKTTAMVAPQVLLALCLKLMMNWQERDAHDPRLNAMDYRDGLMIAFLVFCPIRLANLAQMRIGKNLVLAGNEWRVQFDGADTKGGKAIDVPFPAPLIEHLEFYLETIRPMIARDPRTGDALWPSLHNTPMTEHGIYTRITRVGSKHLGLHITPHLFRDIAATHVAETAPDQALMAAPVLQHSSFQTTKDHYIHGQQHKASHLYQEAVDRLINQAENDGDESSEIDDGDPDDSK